jgi:peptidoglycan LD-endopeptidase CwlK
MWSRKIDDLIPDMQPVVWTWVKLCWEAGHEVVITCTLRNQPVQDALYMQGREPIETVNAARKACGLWMLSPDENLRPVTWTKTSNHLIGKAIDFAIRDKNHVLVWNPKVDIDENKVSDYEECGKIAESLGLKWGGRFSTPDFSHIQWGS